MKNINALTKLLSALIAILMIACSATLMSCSETEYDPHAGHDHGSEEDELHAAIDAMFPHVALISLSDNYPTVSDYELSDVRKEKASSGALVLRVIKIDGDQYYCTAGSSFRADHILIAPPEELAVGEFLLVNTNVYLMSSERFGFEHDELFSDIYVVFGDECQTPDKISAENAYQIYSSVPSIS